MVTADYCLLARLTSLLPWNRGERLTWSLVITTLFSGPRQMGPQAAVASHGCRDGGVSLATAKTVPSNVTP